MEKAGDQENLVDCSNQVLVSPEAQEKVMTGTVVPRLCLEEKNGQTTRVKLQISSEWYEQNRMFLLDWFKEQSSGQKEKAQGFTCRTMVFMLLLTAVAFLQPAFCPNIVDSQAASLIIRALAEIGFIVSIFVAFKVVIEPRVYD